MSPDAYDLASAEDLLSSAPRPGSPSRAAKLLGASEDLHILDMRDWDDLATLQPSALEWCEE